MAIILEQHEESNVIRLEGVIDIALAAEFKTTLLDALKSAKALRITLNANADLDVTAIQLLWAVEREAKALNVEFALDGDVPETISATLKDAGIERFPVPMQAGR